MAGGGGGGGVGGVGVDQGEQNGRSNLVVTNADSYYLWLAGLVLDGTG